jgi:hypothetical protein
MDPRARDFALRAAAKVAFAGSIVGAGFGCGNTQTTPQTSGAPPTPTDSTTSPTATSTPTTAPTSAPTSNVCAPKDLAHPTPSEVACCTETVHAAVKSGGIQAQTAIDCCKALASWNDAQITAGHGDQESMPERHDCCVALKWNAGITCTPWGPPVPPSMEWTMERA